MTSPTDDVLRALRSNSLAAERYNMAFRGTTFALQLGAAKLADVGKAIDEYRRRPQPLTPTEAGVFDAMTEHAGMALVGWLMGMQ